MTDSIFQAWWRYVVCTFLIASAATRSVLSPGPALKTPLVYKPGGSELLRRVSFYESRSTGSAEQSEPNSKLESEKRASTA